MSLQYRRWGPISQGELLNVCLIGLPANDNAKIFPGMLSLINEKRIYTLISSLSVRL
jgi:hypothetical protein